MLKSLIELHSGQGILNQQSPDKILSIVAQVIRDIQVIINNTIQCVYLTPLLEWWLSSQELKSKNPYAPVVSVEVILVALNHLRRDVIQSSAEGSPQLGLRSVDTPTEVCYFELVEATKDVLRFEVTVNHV